MDLCLGYWQILLSPDAKSRSVFCTSKEMFEFTVLPFGLSTFLVKFQRLMDKALGERKYQEGLVYAEDILIATEFKQRHYEVLREVLQALSRTNLKLKPQKCSFPENVIAFLEHWVDVKGVPLDPDKVKKIKKHPKPMKLTEIRTFLCSYCRKFIWNFTKIVKPLIDLSSPKALRKWGETGRRVH